MQIPHCFLHQLRLVKKPYFRHLPPRLKESLSYDQFDSPNYNNLSILHDLRELYVYSLRQHRLSDALY